MVSRPVFTCSRVFSLGCLNTSSFAPTTTAFHTVSPEVISSVSQSGSIDYNPGYELSLDADNEERYVPHKGSNQSHLRSNDVRETSFTHTNDVGITFRVIVILLPFLAVLLYVIWLWPILCLQCINPGDEEALIHYRRRTIKLGFRRVIRSVNSLGWKCLADAQNIFRHHLSQMVSSMGPALAVPQSSPEFTSAALKNGKLERSILIKRVKELQAVIAKVNKTALSLQEENMELRGNVTSNELRAAKFELQKAQAIRDRTILKQKKDALKEKLEAQLAAEKEEAQRTAAQNTSRLEAVIAKLESEMENKEAFFRTDFDSLAAINTELRFKLSQTHSEIANQATLFKTAENRVAELEMQNTTLTSRVAGFKKLNGDLEDRLAKAIDQECATSANAKRAQDDVRHYRSLYQNLKPFVADLETRAFAAEKRSRDLEFQAERYKLQKEQAEGELADYMNSNGNRSESPLSDVFGPVSSRTSASPVGRTLADQLADCALDFDGELFTSGPSSAAAELLAELEAEAAENETE